MPRSLDCLGDSNFTGAYTAYLAFTGDKTAAAVLLFAALIADRSGDIAKGMPICLKVPEVATRLGVSQGTIRNLVTCGKLAASRIGKGRGTLRFDPANVDEYQKLSTASVLPIRHFVR